MVKKIIHVFVDALPHVPEHRRLPILSQLLEIVGAGRFLWVLLVLFFEQHVSKTVEINGEKVSTGYLNIECLKVSLWYIVNI